MQGKDTLALLPTGGGKSICFQVPALAMDGMCLVISPLIALMSDQVHHLRKRGIPAVAIHSGINYRDTDTLLDNCVYGSYKFLYLSPERLSNEMFRARLQKMKINLLAIDEAHCISQWGYDFRPPYLKIAEIRPMIPGAPVVALTATATPRVVDDIQEKLLFREKNVFRKSFIRNNLSYVVRKSEDKVNAMRHILQRVPGSAVVYVRNRKKTKEAAQYLQQHGIKADYYHAGLDPMERSRKQSDWIQNKTRVICCTNAFGMGIDKPDVRTVIHLDPPDSLEAYFQEAGRAGRDEKKSYAVMLYDKSDITQLEKNSLTGYPDVNAVRDIYDKICMYLRIPLYGGPEEGPIPFDIADFCHRYALPGPLVLKALQILAHQGWLLLSEDFFLSSTLRITTDRETLFRYQQMHKADEPLIKMILRTAEGVFEHDVNIDEMSYAHYLGCSYDEVVQRLHTLHKRDILHYIPLKETPAVLFLSGRVAKEHLRLDRQWLDERLQTHREKLNAVLNYLNTTGICRSRMLVSYFGEMDAVNCGVCDVCLTSRNSQLSPEVFAKSTELIMDCLRRANCSAQELFSHCNLKTDEFRIVMNYLTDSGVVIKTPDGEWALSE